MIIWVYNIIYCINLQYLTKKIVFVIFLSAQGKQGFCLWQSCGHFPSLKDIGGNICLCQAVLEEARTWFARGCRQTRTSRSTNLQQKKRSIQNNSLSSSSPRAPGSHLVPCYHVGSKLVRRGSQAIRSLRFRISIVVFACPVCLGKVPIVIAFSCVHSNPYLWLRV